MNILKVMLIFVKKRKITILYFFSNYVCKILFMVYRVITASILGPVNYGLWSIFALFLRYADFLHLGFGNALTKEVSFFRGRGDSSKIDEIRSVIFSSIAIISAFVSIAIFVSSTLSLIKIGINMVITFYLLALIVILQQIDNYFIFYFFAEQNFNAISVSRICAVLITGPIAVISTIIFNFKGIMPGIVLGHFLSLAYIYKKYHPLIRFKVCFKKSVALIKIGFPMMAMAFVFTLFFTVDKILIFKFLGKSSLGYYGVAAGLSDLFFLFPSCLGAKIFPEFSESYGKTGESTFLRASVCKLTFLIAYVMSFILVIVYWLLPFGVTIMLPQYIPGISAARLALVGILFLSISIPAQSFLITVNRQRNCFFMILLALILKSLLSLFFIHRQMGIEGVAIASNIAYFSYGISIIIYAFFCWEKDIFELLRYLCRIYFPSLYLFLLVIGLNYVKDMQFLINLGWRTQFSIYGISFIVFVVLPFGYLMRNKIIPFLAKK